jgi:hypothetical protein
MLVGGFLAATVVTGRCQGTFYTSRSVFEAALGASTTITFEDVSSLPPPGGHGHGSITNSGVIFATPSSSLYVADPNGDYHPIPGTGKYIWSFDGLTPVSIILPAGMTAFGADFSGGIQPNLSFNATLTVNLVGGASYDYNFSGPRSSWTFFGVSFPQPIANIVYNDGALSLHEEMLDNVTFGVIPEPSTLGLFGLGALLLGRRLNRKHS